MTDVPMFMSVCIDILLSHVTTDVGKYNLQDRLISQRSKES